MLRSPCPGQLSPNLSLGERHLPDKPPEPQGPLLGKARGGFPVAGSLKGSSVREQGGARRVCLEQGGEWCPCPALALEPLTRAVQLSPRSAASAAAPGTAGGNFTGCGVLLKIKNNNNNNKFYSYFNSIVAHGPGGSLLLSPGSLCDGGC